MSRTLSKIQSLSFSAMIFVFLKLVQLSMFCWCGWGSSFAVLGGFSHFFLHEDCEVLVIASMSVEQARAGERAGMGCAKKNWG